MWVADFDFSDRVLKLFESLSHQYQQKFEHHLHIRYLKNHLAFHTGMHDPYHCSRCKKSAHKKMKFCAKCTCAWYCSSKCQAKDWKNSHRASCCKILWLRHAIFYLLELEASNETWLFTMWNWKIPKIPMKMKVFRHIKIWMTLFRQNTHSSHLQIYNFIFAQSFDYKYRDKALQFFDVTTEFIY